MSDDLVTDAADPKKVKASRAAEKIREKIEAEDLFWMLSHRRGRNIYWKWLERAGVFRTSYSEVSVHKTHVNEGRRQMGLAMLAELTQTKPDAYLDMMREAEEEKIKKAKPKSKKKEKESNE